MMESHEEQSNEIVCNIPMEGIKNTIFTESTISDDTNSDKQVSSCTDEMRKLSVSVINEEDRPKTSRNSLFGTSVRCLKKKLLVLDINRLLAASKKNVERVIDYLMGNMKHKLLFCWDLSHCTETSFKTLENKHKPLVFKDLRKIWEKHDPNLPWEKGYYNESNTLLLDDSPYKALLNPPHNSVFPHTFSFQNQSDNSLAAGGDLRQYLDGLANADNIQRYVEQNPFGQEGISKRRQSWNFYLQVIGSLSACQPDCQLEYQCTFSLLNEPEQFYKEIWRY